MENLLFILATSFVLRLSAPRKFRSCFIGDTGCSVLVFSEDKFDQTKTENGDDLYFYESTEEKVTYGIICISMKETLGLDKATLMLEHYINKLKSPLQILHHTGIAPDEDWNTADSRTVTDYWQDRSKTDWKVKGYTNGRYIAVLYVKNIGQVAVNKQDLFLDSFHYNACLI